MKYNLDQKLLGLDGKPIINNREENKEMTLRDILDLACLNIQIDKHSDASEKYKIYQLMQKLHSNSSFIITANEAALLKTLVGESFGPLILGIVWDLLDQVDV